MLTVYSAKQLDQLAHQLCSDLKAHAPLNPLAPEIMVVQNNGVAQWLSLFIAEQEGIAANLKFEFPAEQIWSLVRWMDPAVPQTLPSDRKPMQWALMDLLKEDDDPQLNLLREYMAEPDPLKQEVRCWKLAGRIADVFDQYLTYRPTMLLDWEQQKRTYSAPSEQWQALLWRKLCRREGRGGKKEQDHRAGWQQKLIEKLGEDISAVDTLPQRISVFGVSAMPPIYLKTMVQLSRHIPVNFYNLNRRGAASSPLLQSFGVSGEAYQKLLASFARKEQSIEPRFITLDSPLWGESSFFQHMKRALRKPTPTDGQYALDQTVQVHSCHSPRREVEVLYDQMLAAMDRDKTLEPHHVMVVMTDIETYAPHIEAVFGSPESEMPKIPWHFGERLGLSNPAVDCFLNILDLVQSRFKVTDVLDLLHSKPLRQKFELDLNHLSLLKRWIDENHIRWGVDAPFRKNMGLPDSKSFTWRSGIDSMLLGYAMKTEEDGLFDEIYPYAEIEGTESAALLGRFSRIMHQLFRCEDQARQLYTPSQWSILLREWVTLFLADDETQFNGIQQINEQLASLKEHSTLAGYHDLVSFQIVYDFLKQALDQRQSGGSRGGPGVSFSSMQMVRNIPAQMICVLGMNDGAFPRSKIPVHFDLVDQYPQPGDRSHVGEDRQLFLDTLFATQKSIYFSYTGQSNRQNTELPPSVILREWVDWLIDNFKINKVDLVVEHPLQTFSSSYFDNQYSQLFTYSSQNRRVAGQLRQPARESNLFLKSCLAEPRNSYKKLLVKELIQFFQHPAKYLLQNRFGIYLKRDELLDEDREAFMLSGLEKYQLNQVLLERVLNEQPAAAYEQIAFARNMLPDGLAGQLSFGQQQDNALKFGSELKHHLDSDKLDPVEVDLKLGEYRLTTKLNQIYEGGPFFYRFGRKRAKDFISFWIQHLVYQAIRTDTQQGLSRFYCWDKKKGEVQQFSLLPIEEPLPILEQLLDIYAAGLRKNTPFFSETSYAYAEGILYKNEKESKAFKRAEKKWLDQYNAYSEGLDRYNIFLFKDINPLEDIELIKSFKKLSINIWNPFFRVYSEVK